ncbi:hypothetical protein C2S52_001366 [Perilla frutescens var. hirtella]|uniref:Protein kinase domain-containing protein n=1 Tax=Perilla frutescens var. hirtella TaxID=608512 RepID=A0AAD4J5P6_PERFH|nr:hypothetical protein C2S51_007133 [Perilla frutescens var. frutescens]KAH6800902.1 hypothetical protein C2S52_001366 [Perilla frutescens var. hirtella]KAH6827701.1 hypothetical protein C2S53_019083 [Perilla frutescens var. hirtella]
MAVNTCNNHQPFFDQVPSDDSHDSGGDGRYHLLNVINHGSYGVVYRAWDKETGEIVAIKHEIEGLSRSTVREIGILQSLPPHPSIVELKDVIIDDHHHDGGVFVVMEYVESDLEKLIAAANKKPFTISEVKFVMKQILEGVAFLHGNGVMHRDLKPANILINSKQGRLKICDFGLSRPIGSQSGSYTPGIVTQWYRAPEILLGAKRYSNAIDMWSVGCIMAELVLGQVAFPGNSEVEQLVCIGRSRRILGERLKGLLSASGVDLIQRLLAVDPNRRITADDALHHAWFREFYGLLSD